MILLSIALIVLWRLCRNCDGRCLLCATEKSGDILAECLHDKTVEKDGIILMGLVSAWSTTPEVFLTGEGSGENGLDWVGESFPAMF